MKKVIIIGAGPAGLTAAYELLKRSEEYDVIILEESDSIGGISRTVQYKGNRIRPMGRCANDPKPGRNGIHGCAFRSRLQGYVATDQGTYETRPRAKDCPRRQRTAPMDDG